MRISIDILDEYITQWGSIIIINPNYKAENMPVFMPGFQYAAPEGIHTFNIKIDINAHDKDRIERYNAQQKEQPASTSQQPDGAKVDGAQQNVLKVVKGRDGGAGSSADSTPPDKKS